MSGEAQAGEITDEKKGKVLLESVIDKYNDYNNCSKLHPSIVIHIWHCWWSDWRTRSKMPSVSLIIEVS